MTPIKWKDFAPVVTHANYLKCQPLFEFGPRLIHEHQFIYVVSGTGVGRIQHRRYKAVKGDLFYYGPHIEHWFQANKTNPFELIGLHFTLSGDLQQLPAEVKVTNISHFRKSSKQNVLHIGQSDTGECLIPEKINVADSGIGSLFFQTVTQFNTNNEMWHSFNRGLLLTAISLLYSHMQQPKAHSPQLKSVYAVRDLLMKNADQAYDRSWLKKTSGYHEDYLSLKFKSEFNMSPHAYHQQQKIDRSKELLEHSDLSITAIADNLHFQSIHYFSRVFKAHTQMSPMEYRRSSRIL